MSWDAQRYVMAQMKAANYTNLRKVRVPLQKRFQNADVRAQRGIECYADAEIFVFSQ